MKLLLRRREVADRLGYSQSQILKFERAGLLRPVSAPGLRSVRYDAEQVEALAKRWIDAAKTDEACA